MPTRRFGKSYAKLIFALIIHLGVIYGFWFMIQKTEGGGIYYLMWFALVFFSAALFGVLGVILSGNVGLEISDEGILYHEMGPERVPWSEVKLIQEIILRGRYFASARLIEVSLSRPRPLTHGLLGQLHHGLAKKEGQRAIVKTKAIKGSHSQVLAALNEGFTYYRLNNG